MTMVPPEGPSPFDHLRRTRQDGSEFWSARELMPLLGYLKWERFAETVEQARAIIEAEAGPVAAEREASRQREAFGRTRQVGENFHLSRRACYVTAMRGDSRKPEIRAALLYFAEKTRAPPGLRTGAGPPARQGPREQAAGVEGPGVGAGGRVVERARHG
jgi:DNA-damage-inducible protein D